MEGKEAGLLVNKIAKGIGKLVATAYMGPAGGEAVDAAGGGVDALIEQLVPDGTEDKDQAGQVPKKGGPGKEDPKKLDGNSESNAGSKQPERKGNEAGPASSLEKEGELRGERKLVVERLRKLDWTDEQIAAILAGPEYTSITALTLPHVEGQRVPTVRGAQVPTVQGKRVPTVTGTRVRGIQKGEPDPASGAEPPAGEP